MRKTTIIVSLVTLGLLTGCTANQTKHSAPPAQKESTSRLSKEALDADEQNGVERHQKQLAFDQLLTPQQALQKAQQYFTGNGIKWSLEKDDGRTVWEVEGHQKQQKMQVKLDAATGALIEKEMDD